MKSKETKIKEKNMMTKERRENKDMEKLDKRQKSNEVEDCK
jgi:hypothetical protein